MNPAGLDRALKALGPYLDDVIICGAWAWYLYRRCLAPPRWIPDEFTRDLDCIGRERLEVQDAHLLDRLEAYDFEWVPRGSETPPVAHFAWPEQRRAEVVIEFLVPARGDASRRIVEMQPGLTAQALRHLEILTDEPLDLAIDDDSPLAREMEFRGTIKLPTVGCFVVQKALIHSRRGRDEQVKDLFYVVELLDRENGLSARCRREVVAADARWKGAVDQLVEMLDKRSRESRFLAALSEHYPVERRPPRAYFEREIRTWLEQLQEARRGDTIPPADP